MGQCEVCTTEIEHNAVNSEMLFKEVAQTGLGADIQKLKLQNQQYIKKFKVTIIPNQKQYYRGNILNQKKDGYGQLYCSSFNYYGFFKNDLPNGTGAIVSERQCLFGQFVDGVISGQGKEWTMKYRYEGEYKNGCRIEGSLLRDQLTYRGAFKDDLFDGKGILTLKDESCYEGQFKEGKFQGKGRLILTNKNEYVGNFKNGVYHGYGQFKWNYGNEYKGEYVDGLKQGYGVLTIGAIQFAGYWKKGEREGRGFLNEGEEQVFGDWKDNHLIQKQKHS